MSFNIKVGNKSIGEGAPCFIIAELGINHNGDMELAKKGIDAAALAGVDAVKFQNYRTEDFVSDKSVMYSYENDGREVLESQYDMFKRCELDTSYIPDLKRRCDEKGVVFLSTPTNSEGVAALKNVGSPILKNGSDYLQHIPLIEEMARSGMPTILSTGMAALSDVDDAVRAFKRSGGSELVLLHCTSAYPTPPEDVNLKRIPALRDCFGCPVGLSDHTDGIIAAVAAIPFGASVIEKHFTLDKGLPGPDHRFSADPVEMKELVESVRVAEKLIGVARVGPVKSEEKGLFEYRLSCNASRELSCGHILTRDDIIFQRPGDGLPPKLSDALVGRKLKSAVARGGQLKFEHLE